MKAIRTPEERFENLPDYSFKPNYLDLEDGLRLHYVDEGDKNGKVVLLLHGEPSWSYLYRKMIPILADAEFRVIAPDLIGFGKSDKPTEQSDYTYQKHIDWVKSFITRLDLTGISLFCQDWGGLIGLRIATEMDERFKRIMASNTALPIGNVEMPASFLQWLEFSKSSPKFDIGKVVDKGTVSELTTEEIAAYNAPFPSEDYKAGARIFPSLVPATSDNPESANNQAAWGKLMQWNKPFLTVFGDSDPIMRGAEKFFIQVVPGAKDQDHTIVNAGHFSQEDQGEDLAKRMIDFILKG
ncbi:MAG: haloalkane dehalogenase [Flavobacteriales bacterium]